MSDPIWLAVRVDLIKGLGAPVEPEPGRIFLVGPHHSFADLSEAINTTFGRWDLAHLHAFELADGSLLGIPDPEEAGEQVEDDAESRVVDRVAPGDQFEFTFDLADEWLHRCVVAAVESPDLSDLEALELVLPLAVEGWGALPDQYGRPLYDD